MRTQRGNHESLRVVWVVGLITPWLAAPGFAQDFIERTPWPKEPLVFAPAPPGVVEFDLVVKFTDEARVRVTEGGLISETGEDLSGVITVANSFGVTFARGIDLPDAVVEAYEDDAEARSGREVADLLGIVNIVAPPGTTQDELVNIGNALQAEDPVEYADLGAVLPLPSGDIVPMMTPPHVALQRYRGDSTGAGMDVEYAWSTGAGRGRGIRVTNVERSLLLTHEDFCDTPGITPNVQILPTVQSMISTGTYQMSSSGRVHGTAVVGILFAGDNLYGMSGIIPHSEMFFSPVQVIDVAAGASVKRPQTAIAEAMTESQPGDVVLIERQEGLASDGWKGGPADLRKYIYDEIEPALLRDVIVVLPAGNGRDGAGADLDSAPYSTYRMKLMMSGIGALVVGAGTADVTHARMPFSTHGDRVDVQAWGERVATLANAGGTLHDYGGEAQQYCDDFGKTSAAAALVAGACASIQSYAVDRLCRRLTFPEMRTLLTMTGVPQGGALAAAEPIGPFVDIRLAMEGLRSSHLSGCRFIRGDCNGDGTVNLSDAVDLLCYLFSTCPKPPCLEACDANDDGKLNITDGAGLLGFLFLAGATPPPPGPAACGPDPMTSPDNLGCETPPCP